MNPRVAERKQWAKFGQEKGKPVGPQTDTTSVAENIVFRPTANWKASTDDKSEHEKKKANLKDAKIKCRICSGDHWTTKCPFKDTMAPEGEDAGAAGDMDEGDAAGGLGQGNSSYVPPHLRGRAGATGEKMGGKYERDDLATLRVTNVRITQLPWSACVGLANHDNRSASSQRSRTCATSSRASATSPESSWPRTGKQAAQRASPSSVLRTATMPRRRATRWTAVSIPREAVGRVELMPDRRSRPSHFARRVCEEVYLGCGIVGRVHLLWRLLFLRVERGLLQKA